jgi:biopolymer transport protein ExbD
MSIQFQCSLCGSIHTVYEGAVGHRIRCPSCDGSVEVQPYEPPPAVPVESAVGQSRFGANQPAEELVELEALEPAPPPVVSEPPRKKQAQRQAPAPPAGPPKRKPIIFREERKNLEAEMDMTPMVDVTFQLLIFFMLTASFTMQKSLQIPKPQSNEPTTQTRTVEDFHENPDYVVVRVDAFNTFHVSAAAWDDEIEAPSEQELLVKLRQARQGDAQGNIPTRLLVVANGEALHERVVTAIDAGNDVGMDEVQLVTVEDDEAF